MRDLASSADLARLRADLAAQHAVTDALRARLARVERRRTRPRRLLPLALVALLVALPPLSLLAAGPFTDLDPAQNGPGGHNPNIQAIADAGITKGCDPPTYVQYCPKDVVTREQMASFLARTAGLGGNPPVANALTAVSAQTAVTATSAGNAATVGGRAPNALLRVGHAERTGELVLSPTLQPYLTVTVVAPAPGFVTIVGSVDFRGLIDQTDLDRNVVYAMMYADVLHQQGGASSNTTAAVAIMPLVGGAWTSVPLAYTFPVQAGAQTFVVRVVRYGDANIKVDSGCIPRSIDSVECYVYARAGTVDAFYIPFGYDGSSTLQP